MQPLKLIILALLFLTVLRLFVPAQLRPRWSALLPLAALALTGGYFATVGLEFELAPALLLAIITSLGALRELLRRRPPALTGGRSYLRSAARVVGVASAVGLFGLAVAYPLALRTGSVIRGPQELPPAQALNANPAITVIAEHAFLRTPRDLEFNPRVEGQLWIVNGADNSVAIIHDAHTDGRSIEYRRDSMAYHYMHRPSALAFGGDDTTIGIPGTFATVQESQDDAAPFQSRNFMGPSLFSSDLSVFAHPPGPGLLGSHLDMLHESPLAMGIAWEHGNVYWVFGGYHGNIARYDFALDHGVGHNDHTDGIIRHYGENVVKRVPGVPSHLALHHATDTLFIADTGNGRILTLDITSGTPGAAGPGWEPEVDTRFMDDPVYSELVPPGMLELPSGLELHGDLLFVSDHATGIIHVLTLQGEPVVELDTGLGEGALMGMTFGPDGKLYFVDAARNRILRLDASQYVDTPHVRAKQTAPTAAHSHHGH
jgi:hypothetical protein